MNLTAKLVPAIILTAAALACAQEKGTGAISTGAATVATAPAAMTAAADISPEARAVLDMLHDRKATLKDFTAKIDNSVEHVAGDVEGNTGTVDYIDDPTVGPQLSVHFTIDTKEGKPFSKHARSIILDSKAITFKDEKAKEFKQQLAPAGKPFDPNSLDSPIPLPIGLKVEDVLKNFAVTLLPPGTDPNQQTLRLIPRVQGKFDYKQLDVTIDNTLQLPVKLVAKAKGREGDITTIKFLEPEINSRKAKIPDTIPPKDSGWTIEIK